MRCLPRGLANCFERPREWGVMVAVSVAHGLRIKPQPPHDAQQRVQLADRVPRAGIYGKGLSREGSGSRQQDVHDQLDHGLGILK